MVRLNLLQIKEGKFIITNFFVVLFIIFTLVFPMRIWVSKFYIIFNFSIRRNTMFSRMNMIFFNDTGNVFFGRRSSLPFWQKCKVIFVGKRNTIFTKYTENIIFLCTFWRKMIFHFPSKEWDHIFGGKKYYLLWRAPRVPECLKWLEC